MPVDYIPLLLVIAVLGGIAGSFRLRKSIHKTSSRVICWGVAVIAALLLFWLYLFPGLRLFPKALRGDAESQYELGIWYEAGMNTGLFEFQGQAMKWFRRAAEQGHASSQFQMGAYYSQGAQSDNALALEWFEKAATNGLPEARERVLWFRRNSR
jgi:TPR repeat protein